MDLYGPETIVEKTIHRFNAIFHVRVHLDETNATHEGEREHM